MISTVYSFIFADQRAKKYKRYSVWWLFYKSNHHQAVPIHHEHHHPKPGVCPQPDRDYYNRPGYHQDYYDDIPKGIENSLDLIIY